MAYCYESFYDQPGKIREHFLLILLVPENEPLLDCVAAEEEQRIDDELVERGRVRQEVRQQGDKPRRAEHLHGGERIVLHKRRAGAAAAGKDDLLIHQEIVNRRANAGDCRGEEDVRRVDAEHVVDQQVKQQQVDERRADR